MNTYNFERITNKIRRIEKFSGKTFNYAVKDLNYYNTFSSKSDYLNLALACTNPYIGIDIDKRFLMSI